MMGSHHQTAVAIAQLENTVTAVFQQLAKIAPMAGSHNLAPPRAKHAQRGDTTWGVRRHHNAMVFVRLGNTHWREACAQTVLVGGTGHSKEKHA